MNKREYLIKLLDDFEGLKQVKVNKVANTLQKTDDVLRAKLLSKKILDGELKDIKDATIDNLIEAFGGAYEEEDISEKDHPTEEINNEIKNDEISELLKLSEETLKEQIKSLREELEQTKSNYEFKIKEIAKENYTLRQLTLLTHNSELIEISDEDINNLYLQYMTNGTESFGKAFIIKKENEKLIPKKYYKI